MRTVLIGIMVGCAAFVAGAGGIAQYYGVQLREQASNLAKAEHRIGQLETELREAAPDLDAARAQAAKLDVDYTACMTESTLLRERLAALEGRIASLPAEAPNLDSDFSRGGTDAMFDEIAEEPNEPRREEAERQEEEARRAERFEAFRSQVDDFFDNEIANAPTEEMRARLELLDAYREDMFELRTAMRSATTDEEREELDAQADAARDAMGQLMREQQRDMLMAVGRTHGLKGEALRTFQQDVRNLMESPYFRFGGSGGPGGPGGMGGRRGGFGGRGQQ